MEFTYQLLSAICATFHQLSGQLTKFRPSAAVNAYSLSLKRRALSFLLLLSLLSPVVFLGQPTPVSAGNQHPVIKAPAVLVAPAEPFVAPFAKYSAPSSFSSVSTPLALAAFGFWDSLEALFGLSKNKSEKEVSFANVTPVLPTPSTADLSRARLSPKNATGGTSLYSRNFGWGTGLAGLPGRGLDAGFGISYNSLIWTKVGTEMVFNPNNDNVTPGFRFGFPVVEPSYTDPLTGATTHLMVTPSGGRVEFRLVSGSSDTFETADSSYTQLKIVDSNNLVITGTNGTQSAYTLKNGAFRCASVKDSNGNYITIDTDSNGVLQKVTDTLGRELNVSYDSGGQPSTVTQTWAGSTTHTYATFTYTTTTVNTNFSGLTLSGLTNNSTIKVLQKITFADGSYVTFDYNTYGQVWKVSNYAADTHKLSHTATNLDSFGSAQTDVPRFSELHNWTENFNLDQYGTAQEVVIPVVYTESQSFTLPNSSSASGTLLQVTAPDGTVSKTYVGGSGWMEAVPVMTEDWVNESGWVRKRWTWTGYTQDNTSLNYILNPRAVESQIGDGTNVKRTTIDYHTQSGNAAVAVFGLVKDVTQYDAGGSNQLKRSHTEYNLDSNYLNRRIIGLPAESTLYDHNNALMSKVTYNFDEGNFSGTGQNISAVQHDATNYGTGFSYRGNTTSTTRWDVTAPTNGSLAVTSSIKYNITGNPISKTDPLSRTIAISYTDNYDDSTNHYTYAYPTTITDPASNSSTIKYRYDIGVNVYAVSPAPAGNSYGKATSRLYDSVGRLEKETIVNTGAYTRYEYPTNGIQSKVYATITDVNSNGADSSDEVLTESFTDGAGRTMSTRTEHPGSTGGYSATLTQYDIMGRVKKQSVPTEVNSSWQAAGDDSTRGFLWTTNEYDWKGRITRTINTDSNGSDGKDKLFSYDGCGCAGGQVTTTSSEQLTEGRRRQKVYEDILGRTYKSETLNWDNSVYSTTKTTFNGRDQATLIRQYAGNDSSSTYQDTVMTYDGHGRLSTQHRPEQDTSTATVYNYNIDDTVQSAVDARGATATYTYNSRKLVDEVSYSVPGGSGISVTPTVTFSYDNVGNRTQMTDGLGNVVYEYDELSHLVAETRQFTDTLANAPLSSNRFKLQYGYSLSGQLKSYTDPYGQQFNYGFDKVGRLSTVSGSTSFGGVTNYANNPGYRAWGGLKHLEYGDDNSQMNQTFNNRLQAASFVFAKASTNQLNKEYNYLTTGDVSFIDDKMNIPPTTFFGGSDMFDRLFNYDHLGRVTESRTGAEARGSTDVYTKIPYSESFTYDAFGHTTQISGSAWDKGINPIYIPTFVNNRATDNRRYYDAEGHETSGGYQTYTYDAAGKLLVSQAETVENTQYLDGEGQDIKRSRRIRESEAHSWGTPAVSYYIKSSVMGRVISEVQANGAKERSYVYGGGTIIARQIVHSGSSEQVDWEHRDATGMSLQLTTNASSPMGFAEELNVAGNNVGAFRPLTVPPLRDKNALFGKQNAQTLNTRGGCELDGIETDCSQLNSMGDALNVVVRDRRGRTVGRAPVEKILDRLWIPEIEITERDARYENTERNENYIEWGVVGYSVVDLREPQNRGIKLDRDRVQKIVTDIQAIFKANPDCLPYLQSILKLAQSNLEPSNPDNTIVSNNPINVIWKIFEQGGIIEVDKVIWTNGQRVGAYADGFIGNPKRPASVVIEEIPEYQAWPGTKPSKKNIDDYRRRNELKQAADVLDEVIHHSGRFRYDDRTLAISAYQIRLMTPPDIPNDNKPENILEWSREWHMRNPDHNKCSYYKVLEKKR